MTRADVVDQLDNLLGQPVAGRRFAGEDIRARHGGRPAVFNQRQILMR